MLRLHPTTLLPTLALATGLLTMCADPNLGGSPEEGSEAELPAGPAPVNTNMRTKVSISPFPYDLSPAATAQVKQLLSGNRTMNSAVLNNGVPWQEALDGKPYPQDVMNEWATKRGSFSSGLPVYLALQSLHNEHNRLADGPGGKAPPSWVKGARPNDPRVMTAYRNHVLRAIDYFKPTYLNLGVECGDMAVKAPSMWPDFMTFYADTKAAVKKKNSSIKVGLSWGLPLLMKPGVLQRCEPLISNSDYVGLSFYPYMGQFYTNIGGVRIPSAAPTQWREPYQWVRQNIRKPVAICETGYLSESERLGQWNISMTGSPALQSFYVQDLARIAQRDNYLFTMFFLSVDYGQLRRKLNIDYMKLWETTGFFNANLKPKPAWATYQRAWLGRNVEPAAVGEPASGGAAAPSSDPAPAAPTADGAVAIPMNGPGDLFQSTQSVSHLPPNGMRWQYAYSRSDWAWALKTLPGRALSNTSAVAFDIKSNGQGPLILQLEENGGEAHFKVVEVGTGWKTVTLPYSSFEPDPNKRKNGKVDAGDLKSILFADSQGVDGGATGNRTVELSNLRFTR